MAPGVGRRCGRPNAHSSRVRTVLAGRLIPWVLCEMLMSVLVDDPADSPPETVHSAIRKVVVDILGDVQIEAPPRDPPLLIPTLKGQAQLVFAPVTLGAREPRAMREAV